MPMKSQLRIAFALWAAICMWLYAGPLLKPYVFGAQYSAGVAGGRLADMYPSWFGTREMIVNHRNPYGQEVTQDLQIAYYGHVLASGDQRNQQRFAYPVYIAFLFAPTVRMPFHIVQMIGFWVLALITAASVPLWLRVVKWDASWPTLVALQILALSSIAAVHGLELQQMSLLVGGLTSAAALLMVRRKLFAAGCLFGLAMIKPQMLVLPILWLLFWSLTQWRERQRFVIGFGATLALLVGGGEWILPGWIGQFVQGALAYSHYAHPTSVLEVLLSPRGFVIAAFLLVLILAHICFRFRSAPPDSPEFAITLALLLAANLSVLPLMSPYNQVLLLPGVLILLRSEKQLWVERWLWRLTTVALIWPWITAALVVVLSWLHSPLAAAWIDVPLYSTLTLPLLVTAALMSQALHGDEVSGGALPKPQIEV